MFEGIGEWLRQLELERSRSGKKGNAFHLRQFSIHMVKRLSRKLWLTAFSSIMDWETKIGSLGQIRKNMQSFSQELEGLYPKRKGKSKEQTLIKTETQLWIISVPFWIKLIYPYFSTFQKKRQSFLGKYVTIHSQKNILYTMSDTQSKITNHTTRKNLWKPEEKTVEMNLSGVLNTAIICKH